MSHQMNSSRVLKVGLIGAGQNTRKTHIPGLQAIDGVMLACVANRSPASARQVADEFGIPAVYEHWRQVIDDPSVDAVVIGTWPYLHAPVTIAALQAGKHVLCEARMAMNLAEAQAMLQASRSRPDLVAQLVPSPMTLAIDATIRQTIAQGKLGPILAVELRDARQVVDLASPITWRQDVTLSGLNVMTLGIWYEAMMRWVGPAVNVQAISRVFTPMRPDGDVGGMRVVCVPDHLEVIGELAIGAVLRMQISQAIAMPQESGIWISGRQATLRIPLSGDRIFIRQASDPSSEQSVDIPPSLMGRWRVEQEFIAAIRGQESVRLTDLATGVQYMRFTQAVAESALGGGRIALVP